MAIGFVVVAFSKMTLIGLGTLCVALALIYINLSISGGNDEGVNYGDPLRDVLNDY
jgi:PTS system mannose-specific IIC component